MNTLNRIDKSQRIENCRLVPSKFERKDFRMYGDEIMNLSSFRNAYQITVQILKNIMPYKFLTCWRAAFIIEFSCLAFLNEIFIIMSIAGVDKLTITDNSSIHLIY